MKQDSQNGIGRGGSNREMDSDDKGADSLNEAHLDDNDLELNLDRSDAYTMF